MLELLKYKLKAKKFPKIKIRTPNNTNRNILLESKIDIFSMSSFLYSDTYFIIVVPNPKSSVLPNPQIDERIIHVPNCSFPKCSIFIFNVITEITASKIKLVANQNEFVLSVFIAKFSSVQLVGF